MAAGNPRNTSPSKDDGGESQSTPLKKKVGKKDNSGSSKKMTAKEQSERFIKTARELECDESEEAFTGLIKKIVGKNLN